MTTFKFLDKRNGMGEVIRKILSLMTISVGGWIIFDKVRKWLQSIDAYGQYSIIIAIILLYIGMVIIDLE